MMMPSFMVRGVPAPQGSKRAITNRYTGKPALVESSQRVKPWRADIRAAAEEACPEPFIGAVSVVLTFVMPRPKGHYGSGRNALILKESAPRRPVGKPDLDKLVRAALDGMTGIAYVDDAQVVGVAARKRFSVPADGPLANGGLEVMIEWLTR